MRKLISDWKTGRVFFSHRRLQSEFKLFMESLSDLNSKIAKDTTQELIAGAWVIGYKPPTFVTQEEYDRRMRESKKGRWHR